MRRTRRSLCRRLGFGSLGDCLVVGVGARLSAVRGEAWRTSVWHGLSLLRCVCVCRGGLEDAGLLRVWLAYALGVSLGICFGSLIFEDTSNTAVVLPPLLRCAFYPTACLRYIFLVWARASHFYAAFVSVPATSLPPRRDLCFSRSPVVVSSVRTLGS